MKYIFLMVEGQSEELFYKTHFQKEFENTLCFEVRRPGDSGGKVSFEKFVRLIRRAIKSFSYCEKFFIVYDYYGLHPTFKEHLTEVESNLEMKIQSIQQRFESEINDYRFKFILQVHEFEAYLFTEPQKIAEHYNAPEKSNELTAILNRFSGNPESINDNIDTAPSKRIINVFPQYKNGKTTDGVSIAGKIGIRAIREKCQYFNAFCEEIELV